MHASSKYSRRIVLGFLAAAAAPGGRSLAQGNEIVRLIVPFTPGTGPDLLARILGEEMTQRLNDTVSTTMFGFVARELGHWAAFMSMAAVAGMGGLVVWFPLKETKPAKYD